jgi:hypothetical protein
VEKYRTARHATDDNVVRHMRIACRILKATNTHSKYVILIAFPRQRWLRERASKIRTYIACLVSIALRTYIACLVSIALGFILNDVPFIVSLSAGHPSCAGTTRQVPYAHSAAAFVISTDSLFPIIPHRLVVAGTDC